MKFGASLTRIRRFLRDPNARLWETDYLRVSYNNVQRDMALQHRCLEDVEAIRIPPSYQWSYLYDWEWAYLPTAEVRRYKALRAYQQSDYVASYRWELQLDLLASGVQAEDGAMFTHPFEAWMEPSALSPPSKFPDLFYVSKGLYYDKEPLPPVDKAYLAARDTQYRFRSGEPVSYYREDELSNEFFAYPKPSTVDWQDEDNSDRDFIYTYDFESALFPGQGGKFTTAFGEFERMWSWEADPAIDDPATRGMWLFEVSSGGSVLFDSGTFGTVVKTGSLTEPGAGVIFDVIDPADNFLLFYESFPVDIEDENDESGWPEWAQKYIECGVLERAFAANTDGKIKSLEKYWSMRSRLGEKVIKKWRIKRLQDRVYRLRAKGMPTGRKPRPRLPDSYPSV